jgi:Domain of unknown function (DUF1844)
MAEEKPEDKHEGSGFKVVDRRSFSTDGSLREEPREAPAPPPKVGPKVERPAESPASAARTEAGPETLELPEDFGAPGNVDPGFETLVSYLGTTAMFQLGMMAGPGGERIPADLTSAHHTIDMLEVIDRKTSGNLTPDEGRLLEDVLYELRIAFIEVEKRATSRAK